MSISQQINNYNQMIYRNNLINQNIRTEEKNLKAYNQFVKRKLNKAKRINYLSKLKKVLNKQF